VRAARAVKSNVSDAAGAMDSSEQTVLSSVLFSQPSLKCRQRWQRSDIGRQTVPHASRGHRKRAVSDCWQARHRHDECARWCRAKTHPGFEVRHTLEVVGEVRRSQAVEAAVDENCQFVVDPLTHPQPVQLTKKRRHMVVPPWWVDLTSQ